MTTKAKEIELVLIPADSGLVPEVAKSIADEFMGFVKTAEEWKEKCLAITEPKQARETRLVLKNLRVAAEKRHKEIKAETLLRSRAIDGCKNIILDMIIPLETMLENVEKKAEREAAEKRQLLLEKRTAEITAAGGNPALFNLECSDFDFEVILDGVKTQTAAKIEAEKRLAEAKRIAEEKAKTEQEAQKLENIKLKAEAEAREAAIAEERKKAELERQKHEKAAKAEQDRIQKEKDAAEAKAKKERELLEKKLAAEKAESEKRSKEAAAALKAEQDKAKAIQDELERKSRAEAYEKARLAKEEALRLVAEEKAKKKAAAAPDKVKLSQFSVLVGNIEVPEMSTPEGNAIAEDLKSQIKNMAYEIQHKANTL